MSCMLQKTTDICWSLSQQLYLVIKKMDIPFLSLSLYIYIYIHVCVCVFVFVCVCVYVCMCVYVYNCVKETHLNIHEKTASP